MWNLRKICTETKIPFWNCYLYRLNTLNKLFATLNGFIPNGSSSVSVISAPAFFPEADLKHED